jgi:FkbM family methyltransferase
MIWFGFKRTITAMINWINHLLAALRGNKKWIVVTPPCFTRQLVYSLEFRKSLIVNVRSFYDWATVAEIFANSGYDTKDFAIDSEIETYYEGIRPQNPLVLDLGANIGVASLFYATKYPEALILAIEPSDDNCNLLAKNIKKHSNIRVLHQAAGSKNGVVSVMDPGIGNNSFRTFGSNGRTIGLVNMVTVNDILSENEGREPFIIKIDIEGFESELFSSNTDWIDRFKVIVIEIHDWMFPKSAISTNFFAAIGGKRRDLVFKGENIFSVRID